MAATYPGARSESRSANSDKERLGTAPLGRLLFRLAVPTVTAQIINMLYNIVDRIYVGHIPGDGRAALTGLGVCLPLIMLVSAFSAFAASGGAPRASIQMGRGNNEAAERILGNSFMLQIVISVTLTAILLIFNEPLLMMFGASDMTITYAADYMEIYAIGTIFVQLTLGMNAFITAQGFTRYSMTSVIIGAVANIGLDPLFIYAFDLGVRGAAVATIISQALSAAWVMAFFLLKKGYWRLRPKFFLLKFSVVLPILTLGLATFVMQSSESIILICFQSSLQKYGGDIAVGAMTICSSVMQFALLPLNGLGQGAQPIISYNYGAGNIDRVKKAFFLLLLTSLSYSVTLWILAMAIPDKFVAMFNSEPELINYAAPVVRVYLGAMFLFGIQMACQMTFTSIGSAAQSITVAVARKFVLLLPLIYIMPLIYTDDKALAVFMAEPVADAIAVTFTAVLFIIYYRKKFVGGKTAKTPIASDTASDTVSEGAELSATVGTLGKAEPNAVAAPQPRTDVRQVDAAEKENSNDEYENR